MLEEFNDAESQAIAATFREMAKEELDHGSRLQELYQERFGNQACVLTDADIEDVIEVPQLPDDEQFISGGMTHRQVLEVALAAERQARHYYTELAALTLEAPLRGLYQELASLEREHEEVLERNRAASGIRQRPRKSTAGRPGEPLRGLEEPVPTSPSRVPAWGRRTSCPRRRL